MSKSVKRKQKVKKGVRRCQKVSFVEKPTQKVSKDIKSVTGFKG